LIAAIIVLAGFAAYQDGASEIANIQLRNDLHDLDSKLDTRIGLAAPKTDDDYRNLIIRRASTHGISLDASEITVERTGAGDNETITLSADYTVSLKTPGFAYPRHFTASSVRH
jgi:hypothetical protein